MIQDDGVSVPDRATAAEPEVSALRDGIANAWEPKEYLKSPTYKPRIPFFPQAINGQEIVEALEVRMKGLAASEMFVAVHWSVLLEARDEIDRLNWEAAKAIEAGTAKTEGLGAQHESAVHAPEETP